MTGQSKKASILESFANVAVGFGIATLANLVVLPVFGYQVSVPDALGIGGVLTVISILRSYALRRAFNWWHVHQSPVCEKCLRRQSCLAWDCPNGTDRQKEEWLLTKLNRKARLVAEKGKPVMNDPINPQHYKQGGLEAIDVIEAFQLNFCLANCVKYILRAGKKTLNSELQDLKKARWYLDRQIKNLEK